MKTTLYSSILGFIVVFNITSCEKEEPYIKTEEIVETKPVESTIDHGYFAVGDIDENAIENKRQELIDSGIISETPLEKDKNLKSLANAPRRSNNRLYLCADLIFDTVADVYCTDFEDEVNSIGKGTFAEEFLNCYYAYQIQTNGTIIDSRDETDPDLVGVYKHNFYFDIPIDYKVNYTGNYVFDKIQMAFELVDDVNDFEIIALDETRKIHDDPTYIESYGVKSVEYNPSNGGINNGFDMYFGFNRQRDCPDDDVARIALTITVVVNFERLELFF